MEEEKKGKLKVIYSELRGYLAQAPEIEGGVTGIFEESIWTLYNKAIDSLKEISGKDYSHFCIEPKRSDASPRLRINITAYKSSLSGLVSSLREEYFPEEPDPLHKSPSTVMIQDQQQGQSVHIQMIHEIRNKIDEKISNYQDGSKEKSFLQKLKSSLSSILNVNQLIQTILKLAKDSGLDINEAWKIFT